MNRTRIGVLAFPISGLVLASAALAPGIGINPAVDPAGFAQTANYVGLVNLVGIVSLVFLLFGFQALHAYLERNSVNMWAFAGMILSMIGLGLYLPFLGIIAFAAPVAGRFYLSGDLRAVNIISEATGTSNTAALAFGGISVLSSVLGAILFSVAIWRSRKLPKWSAFVYAISAPLKLDSALRSCSLAPRWNTPFRSWDWNYARNFESSKRRKVSHQIEPSPSTRNLPG
jgi:hypothetical protein